MIYLQKWKSNEHKRYTMIINLMTEKKFDHLISEIGYFSGSYHFIKDYLFKCLREIIYTFKGLFKNF